MTSELRSRSDPTRPLSPALSADPSIVCRSVRVVITRSTDSRGKIVPVRRHNELLTATIVARDGFFAVRMAGSPMPFVVCAVALGIHAARVGS
jgi:hypothetical protein